MRVMRVHLQEQKRNRDYVCVAQVFALGCKRVIVDVYNSLRLNKRKRVTENVLKRNRRDALYR